MNHAFEPWQLKQLVRLAQTAPNRVAEALNLVWEANPELFQNLAIAAVDQEQLSVADCAIALHTSVEDVEARLLAFRQSSTGNSNGHAVVCGDAALMRLPESGVAVWEIVRVFRQRGSWDQLCEAFSSVSHAELSFALEFAEKHLSEIDRAIDHYETMLQRRKAEYPFAR
jgi:uncharacterized protein (DUF433 family)